MDCQQFWPILAIINEMKDKTKPMIIAIFHGDGKPNLKLY